MSALEEVLEFWFAEGRQKQWFGGGEAFDGECRRALLPHLEAQQAGRYETWRREPQGCLGLVLLLDQLPRNIYRNTPRAFAFDAEARAVTRHALEMGFDEALKGAQRLFLYIPLEHSEDLKDQEACLRLIAALGNNEWRSYAEQHLEIIRRFGRFPHRNAILGRESTEEELEFLKQPNSSF